MKHSSSKKEKEEYLEKLWYMKEESKDSLDSLKETMGRDFDMGFIEELKSEQLIDFDHFNKTIKLTDEGCENACKLIRSHRLAERMLHDIIGGDFEKGACEFEHTVNPELVDSICTLLGHPKECPHGLPIPPGECCKKKKRVAESSVVSLKHLKVGQSAKIAFVTTKNDQQLHKIDGMHIRPGAEVKLHQVYPTYVIECEGVNIALDEEITSNISVWRKSGQHIYTKDQAQTQESSGKKKRKGFFGSWFGRKQ